MYFCAHQGFAGPSACILAKGHTGPHSYGHLAEAIAKDRERDAERYRWLRERPLDPRFMDGWYVVQVSSDGEGEIMKSRNLEDLDAALDAAMLKTPNVALRGEPLAASPSRKQGSAAVGPEKGD